MFTFVINAFHYVEPVLTHVTKSWPRIHALLYHILPGSCRFRLLYSVIIVPGFNHRLLWITRTISFAVSIDIKP